MRCAGGSSPQAMSGTGSGASASSAAVASRSIFRNTLVLRRSIIRAKERTSRFLRSASSSPRSARVSRSRAESRRAASHPSAEALRAAGSAAYQRSHRWSSPTESATGKSGASNTSAPSGIPRASGWMPDPSRNSPTDVRIHWAVRQSPEKESSKPYGRMHQPPPRMGTKSTQSPGGSATPGSPSGTLVTTWSVEKRQDASIAAFSIQTRAPSGSLGPSSNSALSTCWLGCRMALVRTPNEGS